MKCLAATGRGLRFRLLHRPDLLLLLWHTRLANALHLPGSDHLRMSWLVHILPSLRHDRGLLGLQSLDILQERVLMAFGLDVLVDLAEGAIGVDDKAGAIPVHRAFVLALPHPRRL